MDCAELNLAYVLQSLRVDLEAKLSAALGHTEQELRRCSDATGVVHFLTSDHDQVSPIGPVPRAQRRFL